MEVTGDDLENDIQEYRYQKVSSIVDARQIGSADVRVGDSAQLHKSASRESAPKWRGPAAVLDISEVPGLNAMGGFTAKFQSRTFKVVCYSVSERIDPREVSLVDGDPGSGLVAATDVCNSRLAAGGDSQQAGSAPVPSAPYEGGGGGQAESSPSPPSPSFPFSCRRLHRRRFNLHRWVVRLINTAWVSMNPRVLGGIIVP